MGRISIIGAGSWGTALGILLSKNGHDVIIWSVIPEEVEQLNTFREHRDKLPGVMLPENITVTTDLEKSCTDRDILVFAVPSIYVRSTARKAASFIKDGQIITNVAKGIEEDTLCTLTEIIEEEVPQANVAVLSGPSHAEEVARGIPTTVVVGAKIQIQPGTFRALL